jgi:PTH1 family peptidyl-tRNA hydrolase
MKLIVGLGNPGPKYQGTRHNVGFDVVEKLIVIWGGAKPKTKFQGQLVDVAVDGQTLLLLRPLTFMNLSGRCVRETVAFYRIMPDHMLVICDDINLPLARLRFRARGSSGGQKGLADIIRQLGTEEIGRLRIGIDPPPPHFAVPDYVLSRFNRGEQVEIDRALERASCAVTDWVREGINYCMNRYNGLEPEPR